MRKRIPVRKGKPVRNRQPATGTKLVPREWYAKLNDGKQFFIGGWTNLLMPCLTLE